MDLNVYSLFRLILTIVTLYNIGDLIRTLLRYKPYYDRIPQPVKQFLFRQIQAQIQQTNAPPPFVYRKLKEHRRDFILNTALLLLLIVLNLSLYFI
ncbi:MAG: hypothetical protein ACO4AI_05530 [Prochlorothrix sp.]|nr:hypothetical protein [Prochlorothrix sp.]